MLPSILYACHVMSKVVRDHQVCLVCADCSSTCLFGGTKHRSGKADHLQGRRFRACKDSTCVSTFLRHWTATACAVGRIDRLSPLRAAQMQDNDGQRSVMSSAHALSSGGTSPFRSPYLAARAGRDEEMAAPLPHPITTMPAYGSWRGRHHELPSQSIVRWEMHDSRCRDVQRLRAWCARLVSRDSDR